MIARTCEECGARLVAGATACDLCGSLVDAPLPAEVLTEAGLAPDVSPETAPAPAVGACAACGWANPPEARFCSQCGTRLPAAVPPPVTAHAADASRLTGLERPVAVIVGAAVLLVVAIYLVNLVSRDLAGNTAAATTPATTDAASLPPPPVVPLDPALAARADSLQQVIAGLQGAERTAKLRELVALYVRSARLDLGADVMAQLASTEQDWIDAGNLYYDWMAQQTDDNARAAFARKAIAAYQRALNLNPDNLDVRTDMAIAYMYDPENPMQAIQQTNMVLEKDSTHIQANFNRGILLMQVNRVEQALAQFEKVKRLVNNPQDPVYQRAANVAEMIRRQQVQAPATLPPPGL